MHIISPSPFKQSVYAPSSAYGARRSEAHAVYIYVYMHWYIHIYIYIYIYMGHQQGGHS